MACALETEQGILMNTNVSRKYSVVLWRLTYALPVCNPAISKQCVIRLQCQHNWAVHIVKNLKKFNHVSTHRLSVEALIRYRTLCASCVSKQFDFQWISVISKLQKAIKCMGNAQ